MVHVPTCPDEVQYDAAHVMQLQNIKGDEIPYRILQAVLRATWSWQYDAQVIILPIRVDLRYQNVLPIDASRLAFNLAATKLCTFHRGEHSFEHIKSAIRNGVLHSFAEGSVCNLMELNIDEDLNARHFQMFLESKRAYETVPSRFMSSMLRSATRCGARGTVKLHLNLNCTYSPSTCQVLRKGS